MNKFWNWIARTVRDDAGETSEERILELNGAIAEESWWDDEVTPSAFKKELNAGKGDITVWINSPGGDCFAAAQIYNMLREYPGKVTVKIDSLAASAASVIAMAGDTVLISPTGMLMIHNPSTLAWGDRDDMQKAIDVLDSVRETLINAYQLKTGLSHAKLVQMVDDETWMDAKQSIKLGFCDGMMTRRNADPDEEPEKELEDPDEEPDENDPDEEKKLSNSSHMFAAAAYIRTVTNKLSKLAEPKAPAEEPEATEDLISVADLRQRLQNLKNQF